MSIRCAPWSLVLAAAVMCGVVVAIFASAPKSEDFWWTDSASFALNGALVYDYVVSGFSGTPMQFANEWFRHFPALTISLYPPIFPLAEAAAFGLFGFSHPVAQATVAAFTGLAAFGVYRLCRTVQNRIAATGAMLLMFSAPGVLLWSRQVVMELPALAFVLLASGYLLRYQASRQRGDLLMATALGLAAAYTKQTSIFIAPCFAIALVADEGARVLRNRAIWSAAAVGVAGMIPLGVFTLNVSPVLLDIALGRGRAVPADGAGVESGWTQATAYWLALPSVVGWPLLLASTACLGFIAIRGWRSLAERRLVILMVAWFICDFVFISVTSQVEFRYAMALAVPCAVVASLLVARLFRQKLASWAALGAGAALFGVYLATEPVYRMSGYDKVAAYLLDHSAQDDVVWFQGAESKNLSFALRSHASTPKLFVLRAEKYLVDYYMVREWGVTDGGWTPETVRDLIRRERVSIVVLQPDFWSDLPSMAHMQDYFRSNHFREVAEFPISADEPSQRTTIKVFVVRNYGATMEHNHEGIKSENDRSQPFAP
jgi:hypothetical protein